MEKLRYYKSRVTAGLSSLVAKFKALHRWLKWFITLSTLVLIVGFVLFLLRDRPQTIADVAQESFIFSIEKQLKPFASYFPTLGEDLLLKKIIVNLKQSEEFPEAMGMFEIFLNVKSAYMLQVVKNKEHMVQDVLQRELESFTYQRLSEPQTKKLLKVVLKNKVNQAFKKRLIKRLYFKTYVIQK